MRDQIVETLVGLVVLAVAAGFMVYALTATGGAQGGGKTVQIEFPQVDGLKVGADVKVSGVPIGSVRDIAYAEFGPIVTIAIPRDFQIPTDTSAKLRNEGLLGGVYLQLTPGGADELVADGGRLPDFGQGSIDVVQILADFVAQGATR